MRQIENFPTPPPAPWVYHKSVLRIDEVIAAQAIKLWLCNNTHDPPDDMLQRRRAASTRAAAL